MATPPQGPAGSESSAAAGESAQSPTPLPVPPGPGFEHLVVLMFENRSFDNLLGYLYPPGSLPEGVQFDGLANGSYSNPSRWARSRRTSTRADQSR